MLKQNYINDLYIPIKHFCGVGLTQPIWGEMQHSLWLKDDFLASKRPRLFPRIFTWNAIFSNKYTTPIGDPFLYLKSILDTGTEVPFSISAEIVQFPFVLFPSAKLHASRISVTAENVGIEVSHIEAVLKSALRMYPGLNFAINLHPVLTNSTILVNELTKNGHKLVSELSSVERLLLPHICSLAVSDYPGAHVFRAAISGKGADLIVGLESNKTRAKFSEIVQLQDLIERFLHSTKKQKKAIAEFLLGASFIKSKDDLREVLGFSGWKSAIGPFVHNMYEWYQHQR